MGRLMGLDVGDVRIGVAVSDLLFITAQGVETYTRQGSDADMAYMIALMDKYNVDTVVCGLPRNMNGTEGGQAQSVREFAELLREQSGRKLVYWDERLSTRSATKTLLEADVSRKKRKKVVDKLAAVYILQGYMDAQARPGI